MATRRPLLAWFSFLTIVLISLPSFAASKNYRRAARASFLSGEDFRNLDLRGVVFFSADLRKSNFSRSRLANASFEGSELSKSLFCKARARGVSFEGADLTRADLRGADLRGAIMEGAILTGARLQGAKLKKVLWKNTTCPDGSNSDQHRNTCLGHLEPFFPRG